VVPGNVQFCGTDTSAVRDSSTPPNCPVGPNGPRAMLRTVIVGGTAAGSRYVPENWNPSAGTYVPWPMFCHAPLPIRTSTSMS
jgi:hypothetical protein